MAAGVFVLQAGLIGGLLLERRRRRRAEAEAERHRFELVHASRLAVAGELAGAIAHEINQPLGAILSNADAADLVLESGKDQRDLLKRILADIRRDDVRASEVIRRLRALLQKQHLEPQRFDVNEAVADVGLVLRAEAKRRRVWLNLRPASVPADTFGDRIQLQQVLINLVMNAMEAMGDCPTTGARSTWSSSRDLVASASRCATRGRASHPSTPARCSTRSSRRSSPGMGLGLSIARTLVEAHGGRIGLESGHEGGAVFRLDFPAVPVAPGDPTEEA